MAEKRNLPWAEIAEELRGEAEKYKDICRQIRLDFLPVQQESYESYCAWEAEMDAQGEGSEKNRDKSAQ